MLIVDHYMITSRVSEHRVPEHCGVIISPVNEVESENCFDSKQTPQTKKTY